MARIYHLGRGKYDYGRLVLPEIDRADSLPKGIGVMSSKEFLDFISEPTIKDDE